MLSASLNKTFPSFFPSYRYKLDLVTVQRTLTDEKYHTNMFNPIVMPHFDNHPLKNQLVYMDDNLDLFLWVVVKFYFLLFIE